MRELREKTHGRLGALWISDYPPVVDESLCPQFCTLPDCVLGEVERASKIEKAARGQLGGKVLHILVGTLAVIPVSESHSQHYLQGDPLSSPRAANGSTRSSMAAELWGFDSVRQPARDEKLEKSFQDTVG